MANVNNTLVLARRPTLTGLRPHWWIAWWYWLAAPVAPHKEQLSVSEREFLRRGKLISIGIFIEIVETLFAFEAAREYPVPFLIPSLLGSLMILVIGVVLNRFSAINRRSLSVLASIILLLITESSMLGELLQGQLGLFQLPLMCLLVLPLMFSVLLFPPWAMFVVAAFNCISISSLLLFVPKSAALLFYLRTQPYVVWSVPITLQIVCSLVSFIMIMSLREHIERADHAEEISRLQQDLAAQKTKELEDAYLLEKAVQEIGMVLTNVANRQWDSRVQLGPMNILPSVSGQINNLIGRYIRLHQQTEPMQRNQYMVNNLLLALRRARVSNIPLSAALAQFRQTGTMVDELVQELLLFQERDRGGSHPQQVRPSSHPGLVDQDNPYLQRQRTNPLFGLEDQDNSHLQRQRTNPLFGLENQGRHRDYRPTRIEPMEKRRGERNNQKGPDSWG